MKHEFSESLLIAYQDGELGESERARVNKHLDVCEVCRESLHWTAERQAILAWYQSSPPVAVADAVMARVAAAERRRAAPLLERTLRPGRTLRAAMGAVLLVMLLVILTLRPWDFLWPLDAQPRSAPAAAVAEAYSALLSVASAQVVREVSSNLIVSMIVPDGLQPAGYETDPLTGSQVPEYVLRFREHGEYANCNMTTTGGSCDVVDRATGERLGSMAFTGGRRIAQGYLVPPDTLYLREILQPDTTLSPPSVPLPERGSDEWLSRGGRRYGRSGTSGVWRRLPVGSSSLSSWWSLVTDPGDPLETLAELGEAFDAVERLPGADIDGIPVERYKAQRATRRGHDPEVLEIVEVWIGEEDRLPRLVVREFQGWTMPFPGDMEWRWSETYRFSDFNRAVLIPDLPPDVR